jgi:hypothetical protein
MQVDAGMPRRRDSYDQRYTKPELRRRLKAQIMRSDRGGRPGQWSARKSQLLVKAYERAGGGYVRGKNREEATSLHAWTEQSWQAREGQGAARDRGGMHRYLPAEAWRRLRPEEREEAERSKRHADQQGMERVPWPPAVRRVMRQLEAESSGRQTKTELYLRAKALGIVGRSKMNKQQLQRAIREATR